MTLKELKAAIAEQRENDWYLNYNIDLNFPNINFKASLNGVPAIYEFILKQIDGYNKLGALPRELESIKSKFKDARDIVIRFVSTKNQDNYSWNNSSLANLTKTQSSMFLYDSPETKFLIDVNNNFPPSYKGAYEYLIGSNNTHNKDYFRGYLMAYEFSMIDSSAIISRSEAEKKSIELIRSDFYFKLGDAETQMTEYLSKTDKRFIEHCDKIDKLRDEKDKTFKSWFAETSGNFKSFSEISQKKMADFEQLYQNKLKLEAPAKYWNDRAKTLRKEGYRWLAALSICIAIAIVILLGILNKTSNGSLDSVFSETGKAVKWSVVLITLISFLAFAIKTFSKLTFSSFHLVRDAEEREQLTYIYLALQKEKGVDQTERHLIMQSLFSRADSGLLKDEGSPSMPGNIVDQISKK